MDNSIIFNDNLEFYTKVLSDIKNAKSKIYIETYIFGNDSIAKKFIKTLSEKAKEGLDVKILLDDIGSSARKKDFRIFIKNGGKLQFFRKFILSFSIITTNNYRNHRKIIVIDDKICYIGSSNIYEKSLHWRELNLRKTGNISKLFSKCFLMSFKIADKRIYIKKKQTQILKYKDFEIIRDVPSVRYRKIRKKELFLIQNAKKNIYIETPYFIPDIKLRREFKRANKRGVKITLVIPYKSDIKIIDIFRQKYFGKLFMSGVDLLFYKPDILHSKLMIVDNKYFAIGSANLDNRSAIFQYEITLFGKNKNILTKLKRHADVSMAGSLSFDYRKWKNRSIAQKITEKALSPFKYFL